MQKIDLAWSAILEKSQDCAERLELRESRIVDGTSQSSRSAALAKRMAALGTIMLPNESEVVYHLPKKSGNFGWNVNGKPILVFPDGKFPEKTGFLER